MRLLTLLALLCCCHLAFAQTNAALSGTVTDKTEAMIPGATIIAEHVKTGVKNTTTSNDSGVYSFPTLQPGVYQISAEKPGFKKLVMTNFGLEISARASLNLALEVGEITESSVNISAAVDTALALGTNSVGGVINGQKVQELPLPGRDALGLVLTQAGLVGSNFAGARIGTLNVSRNGINVMDQRINSGVNSTFFNSVDTVDEVKVITSPADAEYGRGSGQVLITTKSGGNQFHGSVFNFHRNTALNANTWFNNLQGIPRNTLIRNNYGGRLGGPIWFPKKAFGPMNYDGRNRSFFFVAFEGTRERAKAPTTVTVFTPTAKQGIYRFYPGVRNGNANAAVPTVDLSGNPIKPATATGDLQAINLFGRDPLRSRPDPTGLVQKQLAAMALPNNYRFGDGLNTAGYTWVRPFTFDSNQLTMRFDHQFTSSHRVSVEYLRETNGGLNQFLAQPLPDSPGGSYQDNTNFYSISYIATLSPRLVNEVRGGASRTLIRFEAPWESSSGRAFLPSSNNQIYVPVYLSVTTPINQSNDPQGRISPLYQYSDTITWLRGKHNFKGGAEVRFASTNGFNSFTVLPRAAIGVGGPAITNISTIPNIGLNLGGAQNMLNDLTGSLSTIQQAFNSPGGQSPTFLAGEGKQRTWRQREFSLFFKDDYKVRPNLTLNLGVRYEYYGVPWEANGKTAGLVNGSAGIFGISGTGFADLYQPGRNNGQLTQIKLVGKKSPNGGEQLYRDDWNNFAPAVGLSWSLPWLGRDKTVLRVGYGIGYERNSLRLLDVVAGDQPGLRTVTTFRQTAYLDLSKVVLPLTPDVAPLTTVPLTDRTQTVRAFDSNLRTPYVQNWNLSIQRQLSSNFALDVRYVGNKGTKLIRGANINEANIFETGILEAFNAVRAGGTHPFLENMFRGLNLGSGAINGTTVTAGQSLRASTQTQGFFANGNVGGFANFVNSTNLFTGVAGGLLRRADLPENFIVGNPQFAAANLTGNYANSTYHSLQVELTKRLANGWTLQSNYTFSKAIGEEEGAGQEQLDSYRNGRNRRLDKRLMSFHIPHVLRNSGTLELPFGPGRKFLSSGNRVVARLVERWQFGLIYNLFSGSPLGISSGVSSFNQFTDNTPMLVGNFAPNLGKIKRVDNGVIFFDGLKQIADPAIANVTTSQNLRALSTLQAITDANGQVLLVNPTPGQLGNIQQSYLVGPGSFRFDMNLIKQIRFREKANFEMRLDAINVLNTPQFGTINTDINSTNFGRVTNAGGTRLFAASLRINF